MKFLKIAALFAFASLPLLFVRKEREMQSPAVKVESDDIFDLDLSTD